MPLVEPFDLADLSTDETIQPSSTAISTTNTDICDISDVRISNIGNNPPTSLNNCITLMTDFTKDTNYDNKKYAVANSHIVNITTMLNYLKTFIKNQKTEIETYKESISQQTNPNETLNIHSQITGKLAPPRPLKPLSISILLGLSFIFFFIAFMFIYKSLPTPTATPSPYFTMNNVKNILGGIGIVVIIVLSLKVAKVF